MELASFEEYIGGPILQRGKAYFEDRHVESLEEVEKGEWIATVTGSEEYSVEVEINKRGVVSEYQCDCPYDGDLCKHVVAVLYAIRDENTVSLNVDKKKANKKKPKLALRGLLDRISTDELKTFILQYSKRNNSFKSDFELFFAEKDDNFDIEKHIRELIRKTTKLYTKRQFIDYGSSGKLARDLGKILMQGEHYLSQKNLLDASKVCMVFINEVMPIITYADDSSGYLNDAIDNAISLLADIAQQAPTSLKEKVADYLRAELGEELYFDYGNFGYDMADLYAQLCVDIGQVDNFIRFADAAIDEFRNDDFDYGSSFFIELKAWVLEKSNRTEEAQQLMEQQIDLPKVRDLIVEKAIASKKFDEAKTLLKEGIRLAEEKGHPGTVHSWEVKLLQIAEKENDVEMVRYYTERFAFSGYFHERYYRQWKATFTDAAWNSVIEDKIATIQQEIKKRKKANAWVDEVQWELQKLGPLYVEEQLFDRLFALVRQQTNLDTVLSYHKHLYKSYATELLSLYVPLLDKHAEAANNRKAYCSLLDTVRSLYKDLVSGQETLMQQMLRWKTIYKHRPAMIDELNKALGKME